MWFEIFLEPQPAIKSRPKMKNTVPAIVLHTQPSVEPVTLAEVKTYLRTDGESENSLITSMAKAAREAAEKYMRISINTQKWKISFNESTPEEVVLPYGPVNAMDSVKVFDDSETETTFDAANYYLTAGNRSIFFKQIPSGRRVEIIYSTGISADAAGVPVLIKQGILTHTSLMYERNSLIPEINSTAKSLYDFYRAVMI